MLINITRTNRISKPFLGSIGIDKYVFQGLTCNNIIICSSLELVKELSDKIMSLNTSHNELTLGLWDESLYNMNESQFNDMLYNCEDWTDNILVQKNFDEIEITFKNYAKQSFFISNSPTIAYKAKELEDIWFVNSEECYPLTAYEDKYGKEIFENRGLLVKNIRNERYLVSE